MTSKCKFIYDPLTLIELVEERPCIWDKFDDDYKDKTKKTRAWTEIYKFLVADFENLDSAEQVTAGNLKSNNVYLFFIYKLCFKCSTYISIELVCTSHILFICQDNEPAGLTK